MSPSERHTIMICKYSRRAEKAATLILLGYLSFAAAVTHAKTPTCDELFRATTGKPSVASMSTVAGDVSSYIAAIVDTLKNEDPASQRRAIDALTKLEIPPDMYRQNMSNNWLEAPLKELDLFLARSQDASLRELAIHGFLAYAKNLSQNYAVRPDGFRSLMHSFESRVLDDATIPEAIRREVYTEAVVFKLIAYERPRFEPFPDNARLSQSMLAEQQKLETWGTRQRKVAETFREVSDAMVSELALGEGGTGLREYARLNEFVNLSKDGYWGHAYRAGLKPGDQVLIRLKVQPEVGVTENKYTKERIDWLPPGERNRDVFLRGVVDSIAGEASVYLTLSVEAGPQRLEVNSNSLTLHEIYARSATNRKYSKPTPWESTTSSPSRWQRFRDRFGF